MPITRGKIGPESNCARAMIAALGGIAALLSAFSAGATPPLSVQRYSLEDGLSQQAVISIAQDAEG